MRKINFLFRVFSMVTTCVVFVAAVFTTLLNPSDSIDPVILWQIPAVSFLCMIGSLVYPWDRSMGKWELRFRIGLHYLWVNLVVLGAGSLFDWYRITEADSVTVMVISIAIVYAVVSIISWRKSAKDARRMNEKLREYQKGNGEREKMQEKQENP